MQLHVSIKGLLSRIMVYVVWPWYSTWTIQEWQCYNQKHRFKNAKYEESYSVCFGTLIQNYGLVVETSCSESGNMGLIPTRCWNSLLSNGHIALHWACQCTTHATTRVLLHCSAQQHQINVFFSNFVSGVVWRIRADRVLTHNMNIQLSLFWSTWSRAGPEPAQCAGLVLGQWL